MSSEKFLWRDREGNLWPVEKMETRHLFHTMRMIWNNTVAAGDRVGDVRLYRFNPERYSRAYMQQAVGRMYAELQSRTDLEPPWRAQMQKMLDTELKKEYFAYAA